MLEGGNPWTKAVKKIFFAIFGRLSLPHEWLHYLPLQPWSKTIRIKYSIPRSEWSNAYNPPSAEVTGEFDRTIPTWVLRFASLAPFFLIGGLCILVGSFGPYQLTWISFLAWMLTAVLAVPSPADISTFRNAEQYREAGTLDADIPVEKSSTFLSYLIAVVLFSNSVALWFPQYLFR